MNNLNRRPAVSRQFWYGVGWSFVMMSALVACVIAGREIALWIWRVMS